MFTKKLLVLFALVMSLSVPAQAYILAGFLGGEVTAASGNPPNAATSFTATVGDAKNTLAWTASAVDGTHDAATSYDLLWGTVSGTTGNTITGVTSPYQHSPLANGTTYYYKLVATNASGSATTAQIGPYTPAVQPPNAPVMTASAGDTKVTYTWSAPAVDATHSAATSYNLRWGTVSGSLGTTVTGVTSPYDLTGRTNGTPVYAKLDALNAGGTTSQTSEVSATPAAAGADVIVNGGFETASLGGWSSYLDSISAGYFSRSSIAADKTVGSYGLKVTVPTGASQQFHAIFQTITSNFDQLSNFSFDYKLVSAECMSTDPTTSVGYGMAYVSFNPKDSGGTVLLDTTTYPGSQIIALAFNAAATGAGVWNYRSSTVMDQWVSFSHQDVKAWLLSHFKAGKTWADVASVEVAVELDAPTSYKIGARFDNVRTGN